MNSVYDTQEAFAVVTAPAAAQVLATIANLPAGFYRIDVTFYTSGTTSSADSDNVGLNVPGDPQDVVPSQQGTSANSGQFQTWYRQCVGLLNTITLTAIGVGGAAAVYHVVLKVTLWPREALARG